MTSPISAGSRFRVLNRDSFTCFYCGARGSDPLVIDHVIPRSQGGTNDTWNLVTACWRCNSGKSDLAVDSEVVREIRTRDALHSDRAVTICSLCRVPLAGPVAGEDPWEERPLCFPCSEAVVAAHEDGIRAGRASHTAGKEGA